MWPTSPTVTLLEAMRRRGGAIGSPRSMRPGSRDVFELGVPRLLACRAAGWREDWAMTATYLAFLAAFPDTHVVRRHGAGGGERGAPRGAARLERRLSTAAADPRRCMPSWLAYDRELKARGINPGTSADLTVASHFAAEPASAPQAHRQIE